ncbi:MAG: ABC transporter permease, partial [Desulfobacterales bacterium]
FALLAPGGIRLVGRAAAGLLYPLGAAPAFLAGRYVRRTGAQTAISVGALITAVALYSALVIMIHSFRGTVALWVQQTISGDLFVTTRNAEANQTWEPMAQRDMAALAELAAESNATLVASRRFSLSTPQTPYQLDFLDLKAFQRVGRFMWLKGDPDLVMADLIAGRGVLVSEVFANRSGLTIGADFEADVSGVRLKSPILGVIRDYRTRGGVVFASLPGFSPQFGGLPWGAVRFFLNPASGDGSRGVAQLQTRIVQRLGDRFDMLSGADLRAAVLRIFDETFAVTGLLLLIALAVAALGITTTMTVLVLQRIRQINTIRAVGGSSGQVRRMILWETLLIVTAGELAGLICGFMLSYILIFVINRQSFGWTFLYGVEWRALALSLPLILVTALGAALPAVGAAFKQPPAMLLRE